MIAKARLIAATSVSTFRTRSEDGTKSARRGRSICTLPLWKYTSSEGVTLAKKTVRVSDVSGEEIPDGKGAVVRITFADARRGSRELDMTDGEAEKLGGRMVARRGRRPKAEL